MVRKSWLPASSALALACTFAGAAGMAPTALAAGISESHVATPIDGTLVVQNEVTEPSKTFTVEGTTNGTTGDSVDILCYQGAARNGGDTAGVPVEANGSFSASIPESDFRPSTCHLLAVPHGTKPNPGTAYTGPRVGFSSLSVATVSSGPNAGDPYNLFFGDDTMSTQGYLESIDSCGPFSALPDGSAEVNISGYLLDCAGNFYNSPVEFFATKTLDLTRAEIEVDGQNAYGSDSAASLFARNGSEPSSSELPGFPAMSATLEYFNPSTGEAQTTESEQLVRCTPEDIYAATAQSCTAFASTGVLDRARDALHRRRPRGHGDRHLHEHRRCCAHA